MANYYTLFRIGRDFAVTQKVYGAEGSIYDRIATALDLQRAEAAAAAAAASTNGTAASGAMIANGNDGNDLMGAHADD